MALIKCPECGKEISDKAKSCPNCGFPITKGQDTTSKLTIPLFFLYSEEINHIFAKCPKCGQIIRIKRSQILQTNTGYTLIDTGKCLCGQTFKKILRDEKMLKDVRKRCPKCFSTNLSIQKEGFSAGSACCGALIFGPLGLLCGSKDANQLNCHCLDCGHKWRIG